MKKIFIIFLFTLLFPAVVTMAATNVPHFVRIGLVNNFYNTDKITITNKQISIGYDENNIFYESVRLSAGSSFYMTPTNLHYIRINQEFATYEEARAFANSFSGNTATPCNTGIYKWMVYIGGYGSESQAINDSNAISYNTSVVSLNNTGVVLMDGNISAVVFHNPGSYPQITDSEYGIIGIGQKTYRGRIEFSRYKVNFLAINILSMDEYLFSVVPAEMNNTWHIEALKAQAVAARCYAVTRYGIHNDFNYGLCDSTHCQAYAGASNEAEATCIAVLDTTGIIAYYNNEVINAVYFSSSGGVTESSENVWNEAVPYLRSVIEINEQTAKEWTRSFTLADISELMISNNLSIGSAVDVKVGKYTAANRVNELVIVGTNGTKTLTKEAIRTFFSSSKGGSLDSLNFTINGARNETQYTSLNVISELARTEAEIRKLYAIAENASASSLSSRTQIAVLGDGSLNNYALSSTTVTGTASGGAFVFVGRGYGHAVGMSQYGANGMAKAGYTYDQILKHYYTGIEVR